MTKELEDKLREIKIERTEFTRCSVCPEMHEALYRFHLSSAEIAQIFKAFEEAGWRQVPRMVTVSSVEEAMKIKEERIPVMTAQEWYDRFEQELNKYTPSYVGNPHEPVYTRKKALSAARRAAGLE